MDELNKKHKEEIAQFTEKLGQIDSYFPHIKELMPLAKQCREVGFTEEMTRQLVNFQPVVFKGSLYSKQHKEKVRTEHSTATIKENLQKKGTFLLYIDGTPILEWFKMKFQEIKEKLNSVPKVENKSRAGLKI